jgi:hypothetical protein
MNTLTEARRDIGILKQSPSSDRLIRMRILRLEYLSCDLGRKRSKLKALDDTQKFY